MRVACSSRYCADIIVIDHKVLADGSRPNDSSAMRDRRLAERFRAAAEQVGGKISVTRERVARLAESINRLRQ